MSLIPEGFPFSFWVIEFDVGESKVFLFFGQGEAFFTENEA